MASRNNYISRHRMAEEKDKMEQYKNLKKRRTFIQDQVNRFITFFNSKDNISKNHALTMNTQLDILWDKYQKVQNEISQLLDEDKIPHEELNYCTELEKNYYDLKLRNDDILEGTSCTGRQGNQSTHIAFIPYQTDETVDNFVNRLETYFTLYNTDDEELKKLIFLSSLTPSSHQLVYDILSPGDPKLMKYDVVLHRFKDAVLNTKAHRFY